MKYRQISNIPPKAFLFFTLFFCVLLICFVVFLSIFHGSNDIYSFSESVVSLEDDWTLTDSSGRLRTVDLPQTLPYGQNGTYTFSCTLPEVGGLLISPSLRFYSNYVNIKVSLNGKPLYSYPKSEAAFSGATGNTYHFIRMPSDYAGKALTITVHGQLGTDITYLIKAPLLGSKATILNRDVLHSLPIMVLAGSMGILAIGLSIVFLSFRKRLRLSNATLFTALFSLLFGFYIYFETPFAQQHIPNGYMLCYVTLTLLALIPLPLTAVFQDAVSENFKPYFTGLMLLFSLNLIGQTILNNSGFMSIRAMVPATHAIILVSILVTGYSLYFSNREEKPDARRCLASAVPMLLGGIVDITLLMLEHPSPNNCLWFASGVTIFILYQMYGFISTYFSMYHSSLEAEILEDMAYHDTLAGIGNRNAYEQKLQELSKRKITHHLSCIVMDINDLKKINDTLGHHAGDAAIAEVGAILREFMPPNASYFRTGGDEFVILLEDCDEEYTRILAQSVVSEAAERGRFRSVPINLAVGYGQYADSDSHLLDFIRRVDTLMYLCKRKQKGGNRVWSPSE